MQPQLSACLIAGELRRRSETGLAHLLRQTALERMEILVLDVSPEGGKLAGADHPRVRYLARPGLRYYCQAQVELVRQAASGIVAFIEDHSFASPGWAQAILKEFENPRTVAVNYTFAATPGAGYLARSILMAEYGHWMAPHPGGPINICSSTNMAYQREMLLSLLDESGSIFEAEFLLHRALRSKKGEIRVAPGATAAHESWNTIPKACLANGANKRVLGARRAEVGRWGRLRRLAWAGGCVLLPPLFLARLAWALRNRPGLWLVFLLGLPVTSIIYGYCAWSEALGYLLGAGTSREEFRSRELAVVRNG